MEGSRCGGKDDDDCDCGGVVFVVSVGNNNADGGDVDDESIIYWNGMQCTYVEY